MIEIERFKLVEKQHYYFNKNVSRFIATGWINGRECEVRFDMKFSKGKDGPPIYEIPMEWIEAKAKNLLLLSLELILGNPANLPGKPQDAPEGLEGMETRVELPEACKTKGNGVA
jgi:hypothetical protein